MNEQTPEPLPTQWFCMTHGRMETLECSVCGNPTKRLLPSVVRTIEPVAWRFRVPAVSAQWVTSAFPVANECGDLEVQPLYLAAQTTIGSGESASAPQGGAGQEAILDLAEDAWDEIYSATVHGSIVRARKAFHDFKDAALRALAGAAPEPSKPLGHPQRVRLTIGPRKHRGPLDYGISHLYDDAPTEAGTKPSAGALGEKKA